MGKTEQLLSNEELTKIIESSRELMGLPKEIIDNDWLFKALEGYVSQVREKMYNTIIYSSPSTIKWENNRYTSSLNIPANPTDYYTGKPDVIQQSDGSWEDSNGNKLFMIDKSKTNGK